MNLDKTITAPNQAGNDEHVATNMHATVSNPDGDPTCEPTPLGPGQIQLVARIHPNEVARNRCDSDSLSELLKPLLSPSDQKRPALSIQTGTDAPMSAVSIATGSGTSAPLSPATNPQVSFRHTNQYGSNSGSSFGASLPFAPSIASAPTAASAAATLTMTMASTSTSAPSMASSSSSPSLPTFSHAVGDPCARRNSHTSQGNSSRGSSVGAGGVHSYGHSHGQNAYHHGHDPLLVSPIASLNNDSQHMQQSAFDPRASPTMIPFPAYSMHFASQSAAIHSTSLSSDVMSNSSSTTSASFPNQGLGNSSSGNKIRAHQESQWNRNFLELKRYRQIHGHCFVPHTYQSTNPGLVQWVKRQRYHYKLRQEGQHSNMTSEREVALEQIGFCWDIHSALWEGRLHELLRYKEKTGHCNVPCRYPPNQPLAIWVKYQRRQYKLWQEGKKTYMTPERIHKLETAGFEWSRRSSSSGKRGR